MNMFDDKGLSAIKTLFCVVIILLLIVGGVLLFNVKRDYDKSVEMKLANNNLISKIVGYETDPYNDKSVDEIINEWLVDKPDYTVEKKMVDNCLNIKVIDIKSNVDSGYKTDNLLCENA